MTDQLPPPDPAQGGTAEQESAQARRSFLDAISEGSLTTGEAFTQVDEEGPHHQLGHTHLRAFLLAHPKIGDTHADEILESLGLDGGEHIDELGGNQQAAVIAAIEAV